MSANKKESVWRRQCPVHRSLGNTVISVLLPVKVYNERMSISTERLLLLVAKFVSEVCCILGFVGFYTHYEVII